jgi:dolichol-phosphate mannosyltransferase
LSVVVPCYNERANVPRLVEKLHTALAGLDWEAVFVDDNSPDGTAAEVRRIAQLDPHIRCIQRIGRRGLASAVIEGAMSSSAEYVAVMDGDLQHDETRLPDLLAQLQSGRADIAVGSRYVEGGHSSGLANAWRQRLSEGGIQLVQALLPVRITDPMSGFFMLRRDLFERLTARLTGQGFKILLDLLLSSPERLRVVEVQVDFFSRVEGASKLDVLVLLQFLGLIIDKTFRGFVPLRFISFALVGLLGIVVNVAVLLLGRSAGLEFETAQVIGTVVAMVVNFQLNNAITYRDQRLRGLSLARGLVLFMVVCGIGAIANIGIAHTLYQSHSDGAAASAMGAAIGVVWNYAVSSTLVWRRR